MTNSLIDRRIKYRASAFPILLAALEQARLYAYAKGQTIDAVEDAIAHAELEPVGDFGE
ncbi:MAG: hypothetical protein WC100_01775 [Sterolibacterium sp.]